MVYNLKKPQFQLKAKSLNALRLEISCKLEHVYIIVFTCMNLYLSRFAEQNHYTKSNMLRSRIKYKHSMLLIYSLSALPRNICTFLLISLHRCSRVVRNDAVPFVFRDLTLPSVRARC